MGHPGRIEGNCDFTQPFPEDDRFSQCPHCGHIGLYEMHKACGLPEEGYDIREYAAYSTGRFVSPDYYGPGTELQSFFHKWGVPPCGRCQKLAQFMDVWGVQGCRERIKEIVKGIIENAKQHPQLGEALMSQGQEEAKSSLSVVALKVLNKCTPDMIKGVIIRKLVNMAIDRAEEVEREREAEHSADPEVLEG